MLLPALAGEPVGVDVLSPQVRATLRLIDRDGPFPHRRDGVVFNNFERRLPYRPRGYYHEYTVPTPGRKDRGARRIISGGKPPAVFYYTDDHYQSFREIQR
ncbi:MAG: ribonuclease [Betaproteobacteria bacterium HGW-Betaproteobacteria-11]|nr:MAG: ribonuclease [Betaproteobacteria bacterium HGW-Betaproteobacteria-11]